jgi:Arc/MetJ family transcription regulator
MATVREKRDANHLVRTNVVLDDDLVREAMEITGITTKRGVIEEALRRIVQIDRQQRIWDFFGKVEWEGDLDEMRRGRFTDGDR